MTDPATKTVKAPRKTAAKAAAKSGQVARKLVKAVRDSATIDWNLKDSVRAAMRARVKKLLIQYDYPPDKEEAAIDLVIQQAEMFAMGEAA